LEDEMTAILRRVVVVALLAAWSLPAAAATTESNSRGSETRTLVQAAGSAERARAPQADEAQRYAARENQATEQQNFKGGDAYIYLGGGAVTLAVVILLLIILL
jgi:hypothetical protein